MAAGIKILVVCRPGFGNSDRYPEKDPVSGACQYFETVLDHLRIDSLPAIGLASGIVPLVAFAARSNGRITGLLSAGGGVALDDLSEYPQFPRNSRVLLGLHRRAPRLVHLALQAGYRQVLRKGPEYMVQTIYGIAPADKAITRDPSMLALLTASARMLTVHGTETFERDIALMVYSWRPDLEKAAIPFRTIVGQDDPLFTVEKCLSYERALPNYTVRTIPECGQLVFLQAPQAIAEELSELCRDTKAPPSD